MSCECEECGKFSIISNITLCEDCYGKEIEASKKQGALEELKKLVEDSEHLVDLKDMYLNKELNFADVDAFFDEIENLNTKIIDRIKELEGVVKRV